MRRMNPVEIKNPELLEILEEITKNVKRVDFSKVRQIPREEKAEDWTSEEYLKHIIWKGREHDGYPEMLLGTDIASDDKFTYDDPVEKFQIMTSMQKCISDLCSWSGARNNALSAVYPPGGFIGWHNNANAPGFNVLFTWSENGDGQWEHIDPVTKEHVVIPDVKGWQCKYGYYGPYDEPDKVLYHAAKTNCLRTTVAFIFNGDETGKKMCDMLIEEIETP